MNSSFELSVSVDTPIFSTPVLLPKYDLTLDCPRVDLLTKQDVIIHQRGYEIPVTISTLPLFQCFGKNTTISNITWAHNLQADPFTLTANRYNITFNRERNLTENATNIVNLTQIIVFNSSNVLTTFSNTFNLVFLNQTVILNIENLSKVDIIHIPEGQDLIINASQTQFLANTIKRSEMFFNISCPRNSIVRNQRTDCNFN